MEQLDEMLGELLSGDEEVIEGGEGLKGKEGHDEALSGIKLYKGETLLELTERWKLLQKKLYDEEEDTFDLSRVPNVLDNVRFDMLHNPHLGLTETLQKLYVLAKSMAGKCSHGVICQGNLNPLFTHSNCLSLQTAWFRRSTVLLLKRREILGRKCVTHF